MNHAISKTKSFWDRLKEIDNFFEGRGKEHQTLRRLVKRLDKAGISYAIMGGMAVNAHRHERTTKDVDILVTPDGLELFRQKFVGKQYLAVEGRQRRFTDSQNGVVSDVMISGGIPGFGKAGPLRFPEPAAVSEEIDRVRVVNLRTLIELKLAARRHQDFADVVNLIRIHDLDESFQDHLHTSVRRDYLECLDEKRRDDEYKEREGIG
jgi:hypothetical protein